MNTKAVKQRHKTVFHSGYFLKHKSNLLEDVALPGFCVYTDMQMTAIPPVTEGVDKVDHALASFLNWSCMRFMGPRVTNSG